MKKSDRILDESFEAYIDAVVEERAGTKAYTPSRGMRFSSEPFQGYLGEDAGTRKSIVPAHTSIGALKHIDVGTRQQSEEAAYRFAQFFFATCLPPANPLARKAMDFCEQNGISAVKVLAESQNELG